MEVPELMWLDGKLTRWQDATLPITTHVVHYGYGAFEGLRSHLTSDGRTVIFRLDDHLRRLVNSLKILMVPMPFTVADLREACRETVAVNKLTSAYVRPIAFVGHGDLKVGALNNATRAAVLAWKWPVLPATLGPGIRANVSSFVRPHLDSAMAKAKVIGQYVTPILAKRESAALGFDDAILLDSAGHVCEATAQNVFVVSDGVVKTAPRSASILPGFTRDTVMRLCNDAGIRMVEQSFTRDEMYIADEVFATGTAIGITPIREIDNRTIGDGKPGEVTRLVHAKYRAACLGEDPAHGDWLTSVT